MKGWLFASLCAAGLSSVACVGSFDDSSRSESAAKEAPLTGAIWTTTRDGSIVNENHYADCRDVYLNGGPKGGGPGLPPGDYYFMVTSPSGGPPSVLLSSDALDMRIVHVGASGELESYSGSHLTGKDVDDGALTVQLWPFNVTPNPGGEYKAWITPVDHYVKGDGVFGFIHKWTKTDNFKCDYKTDNDVPPIVLPPPNDDNTCDNGEC